MARQCAARLPQPDESPNRKLEIQMDGNHVYSGATQFAPAAEDILTRIIVVFVPRTSCGQLPISRATGKVKIQMYGYRANQELVLNRSAKLMNAKGARDFT